MVALSFGEEAPLVEWTTGFVEVFLAVEVTSQLPGYGGLRETGESVIHYATGRFHVVCSNVPIFVEAVVVDDGGDYVFVSSLEIR